MANNIGLHFDPYQALMPWKSSVSNNDEETSVPTVASDYVAGSSDDIPTVTIPKINPVIQRNAWNAINLFNNSDKDELAKSLDPLTPITQWDAGLSGLNDDERQQWENNNSRFSDLEDYQKDRVWRNQQFINNYGLDAFNSIQNPEDRDKYHRMNLISNAVLQKFGNEDNFRDIQDLSPEGALKLLQSDYKPKWQIEMEKDSDISHSVLDGKKNKPHFNLFRNWFNSDWGDYSLLDRYYALDSSIASGIKSGVLTGATAGTLTGGSLIAPGMILGAIGGAAYGILEGIFHPEYGAEYRQSKAEIDNQDILEKVKESDDAFKKEDTRKEALSLNSQYLDLYRSGQWTEQQVNDTFDKIALNGKRTVKDSFGQDTEEQYNGSNFYSAFKDTDIMKENLSTEDKIKHIAQAEAIAQKYGQSAALKVLDRDMQTLVSENQSGLDWGINTSKNILVGGIANLALKGVALKALYAQLAYGEEGLANYLDGKALNGDGTSTWLDPQYWNKVDQYNDLGWQWLDDKLGMQNNFAIAEANGGISPANNVAMPGNEENFWYLTNEALRMNKFAWSDLITNIGLGKLVGAATKWAAKGNMLAPGVLSTEAPLAAKIINTGGSAGVMAASSLGIDAAYGLNTYQEVLDENNRKIDQIVEKDISDEVARRAATPHYQQEFRQYIDAMNAQRKARAGEDGKWIPVDEEKAWNDYLSHIGNEIREEVEQKHSEDRRQAEIDAANAYAVDATIEGARMTLTNGLFKSFLFDKGTLNALNMNNPYVNTAFRDGQYALGKYAWQKKAAGIVASQVWGGFQSNYFDDVTVGFAKGFGLQSYNNYLASKYNPAAYGSIIDDVINPWTAAVMGAKDALTEHRSFLDGGIGALGTLVTFAPNPQGMLSHKKNMAEKAESIRKDRENGIKVDDISWAEMADDFVSNPIIHAIADAKAATRMTQREINRANEEIKEHGHTLDNIVEEAARLNMIEATREGTSILDAEDAKAWGAFTLASSLLSLKNNAAVQNAQVEPDKSSWSKKRKAADLIAQGLNAMMGIQAFEETSDPYHKAMQTLQDAMTIDEGASDEAQAARQQQLIETFLGLKSNANVIENMTDEEKEAFAVERLKKNASGLMNMINRTEELQKNFSNSSYAAYDPEVKQQLIFQYAMNDVWKERKAQQEEWITGEEVDAEATPQKRNVIARYGSMQGYERAKKAQEKRVAKAEKDYENSKKPLPKNIVEQASGMAEAAQLYAYMEQGRRMWESRAKETLQTEKASLEEINNDEAELKSILESSVPGVVAENILHLPAEDRLRMLDDYYREDYSPQQQAHIDAAKNMLLEKGVTLNEAMERVRDAAILEQRIHDNMEVAKTIMKNPQAANNMVQALKNNRRNSIIDYFNDKVVREAFTELASNPDNLLSEDNVVNAVRKYSTATLNSMKTHVDKLQKVGDENFSSLEYDNISKGIEKVLEEREVRGSTNNDLNNYLSKTKKVNRTETISTPIYIGDAQEGTIDVEQTNEQELSDNDKNLLRMALQYAAERDYTVDELEGKVATDDFWKYVEEYNHARNNIDEQVNPVSPQYMQGLMRDVNTAFKAHQEEVRKNAEAKPVTPDAKSVATPEVQPAQKGQPEAPVNPEEVAPSVKPEEGNPETAAPESAPIEVESVENQDILDIAANFGNGHLVEDLSYLLDRIDKMKLTDEQKKSIKDTISTLLQEKHINTIKSLQDELFEELFADPDLSNAATNIHDIDVKSLKGKAASSTEKKSTKEKKEEKKQAPPSVLVSRDLDKLMRYPGWKPYLEGHRVVEFLQNLATIWNDTSESNRKRRERLNQAQIVFIYDPSLASTVAQSMTDNGMTYTEQAAPVLIAMEISKDFEYLVKGEEAQKALLDIPNSADNKRNAKAGSTKYQIIGAFPSSQVRDSESSTIHQTVDRMGTLRNLINYDLEGPQVLRYKKNGGKIQTHLRTVSSHTEEESIPHGTKDTPKKGVQELMEENMNSPLEVFVQASQEQKEVFEKAKEESPKKLRGDTLYQDLREAFLKRLVKRERISPDADERDTKEIDFLVQKGHNDTYPKIVLIKRVSQTADKNTGRLIVDELNELNPSDPAMASKAKTVIASNSRFDRLFRVLKGRKLASGLYNDNGSISDPSNYQLALSEFAESIEKDIKNNLYVDELSVSVEVSDGIPAEKTIQVHVSSGKDVLATLEIPYQGTLDANNYALFLKDLILDSSTGTVRQGINHTKYERVKWQVNYEDVSTHNNEKLTEEQKKNATDNLNDLYDDGVFEMQIDKLSYPAKEVSVDINPTMRKRLYSDAKPEPEIKPINPTGEGLAGDANTNEGIVDGDTGLTVDSAKREEILRAANSTVEAISKLLNQAKESERTPDSKYYSWMNKLWARVTSMKYAFTGMGNRFSETSGWKTPSTTLGNSYDEFGRDVLNGLLDEMTPEQRKEAFKNYDNSTEKNYAEVYQALKAFEARLLKDGKAIVRVLDSTGKQSSELRVFGLLNVLRNKNGEVVTDKVRVAGALDVLTVDMFGNLQIYDFKASRKELNKELAQDEGHGYHIQLSQYADYLENQLRELGAKNATGQDVKVTSINIIPAQVKTYPTPEREGGTTQYEKAEGPTNQLMIKKQGDKNFTEYHDANYKVQKEFELDRIAGDDLAAYYDKMSDMEKQDFAELVQEFGETEGSETVHGNDIISVKPEVREEETLQDEEDDSEGFSVDNSLFGNLFSESTGDSQSEGLQLDESPAGIDEAISDKADPGTVASKIEENRKNCGTKSPSKE